MTVQRACLRLSSFLSDVRVALFYFNGDQYPFPLGICLTYANKSQVLDGIHDKFVFISPNFQVSLIEQTLFRALENVSKTPQTTSERFCSNLKIGLLPTVFRSAKTKQNPAQKLVNEPVPGPRLEALHGTKLEDRGGEVPDHHKSSPGTVPTAPAVTHPGEEWFDPH